MYGYIYMTINILNGKRYIGKHKSDKFVTYYKGSGAILIRSIEKYGADNFAVELVDVANSEEELNIKERYWIEHYNAVDDPMFYNISEGGIGYIHYGWHHSIETRIKYSQSRSGILAPMYGKHHSEYTKKLISLKVSGKRHALSEEHKLKISESLKGRDPWNKGVCHSEEIKRKISQSCKGRINTEETRAKISKALKGRTFSEETKTKISKSHLGKPLTEYHKQRIRDSHDPNNIPPSCKGKKIMSKGNINKYVNNDEFSKYLQDGWIFGRSPDKCKSYKRTNSN